MKGKISLVIAFALSIGLLSAQTPAVMVSTSPGWHKITSKTVDFKQERDEISVVGADRFSAIRFMVTDAPIDLQSLEIWFEDGTHQDVAEHTPIEAGKESRIINIAGGPRDIDKIVFVYKTLANRKDEKATVEVYGMKPDDNAAIKDENRERIADRERANTGARPRVENGGVEVPSPAVVMNDKDGWHRIAETTVNLSKEKDMVSVMGSDRFAKLKFRVMDAGIEIADITIAYEDGTTQDVPVKSTFAAGQESRIIDIPGAEKDIKTISFVYHTIPNQANDKAHLEIWGYKTNADKKTGMK